MRRCLLCLALGLCVACATPPQDPTQPAGIDYAPLERVLLAYVDEAGAVNYPALVQNRAGLDQIIQQMALISPASQPQAFPTRQAQLAYWINAYNASVLRIVVDHYPISSITRVGLIPYWAFFFHRIRLGGKKLTLSNLETQIIRADFHDPRIHFAINCASRSCPPLARHVYSPQTLDQQLEAAAGAFINDDRNVTLDEAGHRIVLSKIFDWYATDFKEAYAQKFHKDGTVLDYLKLYLTPQRRAILENLSGAKVTYYDYDWGLNGQAIKRTAR